MTPDRAEAGIERARRVLQRATVAALTACSDRARARHERRAVQARTQLRDLSRTLSNLTCEA